MKFPIQRAALILIEMELPAGPTELKTVLYDKKGQAGGAYLTEVEAL